MRAISAALLALACLAGACSSGAATFTVATASVDPTYWCPGGAVNAPYDLHATVSVRNGTSGTVTIMSMTAQMRLAAVQGSWLEKVGDRYDAGSVAFTPSTVGAGLSASLRVVIPSACTSDRYELGGASFGDYAVTLHMVTSVGAFSITAQNHHQIRAA